MALFFTPDTASLDLVDLKIRFEATMSLLVIFEAMEYNAHQDSKATHENLKLSSLNFSELQMPSSMKENNYMSYTCPFLGLGDWTYDICKNILQIGEAYANTYVCVFIYLTDCLFVEAYFLAPPENSYPTSLISTFLQIHLTDWFKATNKICCCFGA